MLHEIGIKKNSELYEHNELEASQKERPDRQELESSEEFSHDYSDEIYLNKCNSWIWTILTEDELTRLLRHRQKIGTTGQQPKTSKSEKKSPNGAIQQGIGKVHKSKIAGTANTEHRSCWDWSVRPQSSLAHALQDRKSTDDIFNIGMKQSQRATSVMISSCSKQNAHLSLKKKKYIDKNLFCLNQELAESKQFYFLWPKTKFLFMVFNCTRMHAHKSLSCKEFNQVIWPFYGLTYCYIFARSRRITQLL